MAEQLHVQIGTIKNHLVRIFDKLQVKSRQEALALLERYSHDST
jgi:DNA-binding NarL/FixJ family response regulator